MITAAGFSHHTAPVHVRERLTPPADDVPGILKRAHGVFGAAALISTCNRVELYLSGEHEAGRVVSFLAREFGTDGDAAERYLQTWHGVDAVEHLYRVATSLDSMVVGETEILGQVRAGFSEAVKAETQDAVLSRLFHTAVRTGRRARNETGIGDGALSVSSIAAQQARALIPDISTARILVIGAGEAGQLAAQALVAAGARNVVVTNRTFDRAESVASALGGTAVPIEELGTALASAQVVIGAAGATHPLVDAALLERSLTTRDGVPLVIIDIAMPRTVDPATRALPGVVYYDLDDLQALADRASLARASEVSAVEAIVAEETARFAVWGARLHVAPTIAALTDRTEALRRAEVSKVLRRLRADGVDRSHVEELMEAATRGLVNQLLAGPIATLNERHDQDGYIDTVRDLFRLDEARATDAD
ncbi:MAG: glutamyl-tRNA reductase [Dehalococcoidia bacterium]|nr:MAG: glutamyl-tRNA reductase [Dehalococcoidia bacterium]